MKALPEDIHQKLKSSSDNHCAVLTCELSKSYLKAHADSPILWLHYGIALRELFRFDEAEAALQKALPLMDEDPCWLPLVALGKLHKAQGRFEQAAHWFQKTVEAYPNHTIGYIYLAGIFARRGDLNQAAELYRRATDCEEGDIAEAFLNLGGVLLSQEKYQEAKECFVRALEIDPEYELAKLRLADVEAVLDFLRKQNDKV